jgi:hypothetical protein
VVVGGTEEMRCCACCAGEKLVEVENRTPMQDTFCFNPMRNGLRHPGRYVLEYRLQPDVPGRAPVQIAVRILVEPGRPAAFQVEVPRMWALTCGPSPALPQAPGASARPASPDSKGARGHSGVVTAPLAEKGFATCWRTAASNGHRGAP